MRKYRNIPQKDIAGPCDIEKSNFSSLEAGNTNPTSYTLHKIAESLKIDLCDIIKINLKSQS